VGIRSGPFISKAGLAEALQRPSSWVLIAANLGLIVAVIAWDWKVFDIVFLYWVENLVIGGINVLKMLAANPGSESLTTLVDGLKGNLSPDRASQFQAKMASSGISKVSGATKLFLIPFFIIHYGMFCYGHGVFVFAMFSETSAAGTGQEAANGWGLLNSGMLFAIGILTASHLFSFVRNFIGAGEYKRTHPATLMMRPYGRIVALHITIILGAFMTMAFGSPLGLLVILVMLKTSVDLAMHQNEREKFRVK